MVSKVPGGATLYLQIAEEIKKDLFNLKYGEQIPSEIELMERYGVSRGTVRQAVNVLVNSGYLYKVLGKGTYRGCGVRSYEVYNQIPSYSNNVLLSGLVPVIADVEVTVCKADETIAEYLCVPKGEEVWKISRYRGVRGKELSCYAMGYIPKDRVEVLKAEDLELSVIDMMTQKFHCQIGSTTNLLYASFTHDFEELRHMEERKVVLVSEFIIRDENGRPFLYDQSINWDNSFKYVMESRYITR